MCQEGCRIIKFNKAVKETFFTLFVSYLIFLTFILDKNASSEVLSRVEIFGS